MDALTSKALESLVKEYFPKLAIHLDQLYKLTPEKREASADMLSFLNETFELLKILDKWANSALDIKNTEADEISTDNVTTDTLSDDEAMMLLAEMDAPIEASPEANSSSEAEIDDDEAYRLLAEMDAPADTKIPIEINDVMPSTISAPQVEEEEDEALKMLRELGDFDSSDEDVLTTSPSMTTATQTENSSASEAINVSEGNSNEPHDSDEDYQELPEWVDNDFRNDADMMNDFLNNAEELLETLDGTILKLEANPNNREIIEEIFRAAHTLKGAAGMFGFKAIEALMHKLENLFDLIRKEKLQANSQVVDLVFKGLDALKTLVAAIKSNKASGLVLKPIIVALIRVAKGKSAGNIERNNIATEKTTEVIAHRTTTDVEAKSQTEAKANAGVQDDQGRAGATSNKKTDSTIRVDLERLDALVNLVGELVTDRTRFIAIEDELRHKFSQLQLTADMSETVQLFGRHMNEVQDIIMKVRMVPIGNAFNKYPRVVRDLARQLDKKIELIIEGEATELDKTLVEQIGDPLIHLIRNACDHGVETPEIRAASGKGPVGFVHLRAFQEGNNIVVTIEDDGKGMDPAKLRTKAIEKGLIKEDDHLERSQIFDLIFEPGFSTAEVVTNVSGRGVGMDVVKKQIAKLKGNITIDSQLGSGSTITISLPLTLAIVQSLLVQSNNEYYAIPLASIIESIRINRSDIQKVGDIEVVKRMDKVLPLIHLDRTLNLSQKKNNFWYAKNSNNETHKNPRQKNNDKLFVVVVGAGEKRFGIVVDGLLHQQEMVIKPMGSLLRGVPCVAGGAVLGSGEVVLVLDMQELENFFKHSQRSPGINSLSA